MHVEPASAAKVRRGGRARALGAPDRSRAPQATPAAQPPAVGALSPDPVTQYAVDVLAGRIVAGGPVRMACERHLRDLEHGPARGLEWRPDEAAHVFGFFRALRLADGEHAGHAFELRPWQQFIVGSLFGWYNAAGFRRFRDAYVEIGKGNGKTPLAAGIGMYMLIADGQQGAECYSAAVGRDQAGICFRDAVRFREASPALVSATVQHAANIAYPRLGSFFRPVSSEGRGLDGKRVHYAAIDEVHEHPDATVYDKMRAGTKGCRNALVFQITNSGYNRNSVCWHHHHYSRQILEGVIENDTWFAYVCALDQGDQWMTDETVWTKTNPNLGVSIHPEYLRELVASAREMPTKQNIVARLNFCVWTETNTRWLPMEKWDVFTDPLDLEALRGRECFGGLDLSTISDVTALAWVFPPVQAGERWKAVLRFWVPEDNIEKRVKRDRVPYDLWVKQGAIEATPGNVVDYDIVRARILEDCERFLVREIAIDRWNSTQISTQLQEEGLTVALFGQGFASMSAPAKELERLVAGELFDHGANPVLRWMASNCAAAMDPAGNIKPDKAKSNEKIDGIVAVLMGLGRAIAMHEDEAEPFIAVIG